MRSLVCKGGARNSGWNLRPRSRIPVSQELCVVPVRELLKNAVKFTEQGSVTVECGLTGPGTLTLSVTDTGCGVEPGLAERVSDRFYKVDPFAQGPGLGLCRLIVEKSGGTVGLDTTYTGGTRFGIPDLRDLPNYLCSSINIITMPAR